MTRDNTAGVSAPERFVSARACRTKSKGRTRQLVSYDVSAVSFRAWLERHVRVKPPKDFRLSDDWLRFVMKAFLLLSPDASRKNAIPRRNLRWPTEGVRRATDVEHVECSADHLEVEGARLSSKSSPWTSGRDPLELLTTAETATSRRAEGTGLYLRQDRSDQQSTTRELAQDVQLSASSAWGSGDWNGDAVTCRSTCAGALRLRSSTIETSYADRREAQENRTDDVNSEAHGVVPDDTAENAKDTADQEYRVGVEEVDAADVSNKESKGLKRRGEHFLEVRKVLETPMQDTGTARERKLVRRSVLEAEPAAANSASREREFYAWVSRKQDAPKAKENLNNLDTKARGREVISSCGSGYGTIPAITLRGVVTAILVRLINANSHEFENG